MGCEVGCVGGQYGVPFRLFVVAEGFFVGDCLGSLLVVSLDKLMGILIVAR